MKWAVGGIGVNFKQVWEVARALHIGPVAGYQKSAIAGFYSSYCLFGINRIGRLTGGRVHFVKLAE